MTPIPQSYIDNFTAIVQVVDYNSAALFPSYLVNYEDLASALGTQRENFEKNYLYLKECIACFPDSAPLQAVGIYVDIADTDLAITYNGVNILINCQYSGTVTVGSPTSTCPPSFTTASVVLWNGSTISHLSMNAGFELKKVYVGSGCSITNVDSTNTGSYIDTIAIRNVNNNPATVSWVQANSYFGTVVTDMGANYGGERDVTVGGGCSNNVTSLRAATPTMNTIPLTWAPPSSNLLYVIVSYKLTGDKSWTRATPQNGFWQSLSGFTFTGLMPDTSYTFMVQCVCVNGIISSGVTITVQTATIS